MGLKQKVRPGDSRAAMWFQLVQWVTAQEITQIPAPFQQATGTPGRESTIQLKKKDSEAGSQLIRLGGSHPHKNKQNSNWKCSKLRVSRQAQLNPGWCSPVREGASAITEALHPYRGTLPLLMQPAVAEATRHNRGSPPLQRWATIATAVLTTPI